MKFQVRNAISSVCDNKWKGSIVVGLHSWYVLLHCRDAVMSLEGGILYVVHCSLWPFFWLFCCAAQWRRTYCEAVAIGKVPDGCDDMTVTFLTSAYVFIIMVTWRHNVGRKYDKPENDGWYVTSMKWRTDLGVMSAIFCCLWRICCHGGSMMRAAKPANVMTYDVLTITNIIFIYLFR
jgi:hypothetical protein